MTDFMSFDGNFGNPASRSHSFGRKADEAVEEARNNLATAIETALESDITRGGNALDTQVTNIESDGGQLFPFGAVNLTVSVLYEHQSGTP